jgi:hypothetical protein
MENLLMKKFATDPPRRDECAFWKTWSNQRFCTELLIAVPDNAVSSPEQEQKTDENINRIIHMFPNATPEMQLEATKILTEKLPVEPVNYRKFLHRNLDRLWPTSH